MQLMHTIIILIMITIFLAVFVPALLKSFSGNLDFIRDILGIKMGDEDNSEFEPPGSGGYIPLKYYIVCAYKTCDEGINNKFCSDSHITPYDTKLQKVYALLGEEFPDKVCGGYLGYTDQFPLIVHVRQNDVVRRDEIRSLSQQKIKCINSEKTWPQLLIDPFGSYIFKITKPDTSKDCKSSYYTPASEIKVMESGMVYVWDETIQTDSGTNHILHVESAPYFINLTDDSDHKETIYIYTPHYTLRRVHYDGIDYFVYLCPKATPGGNCNNVDDASDENAYDVKICNVDEEYCETKDLKKNQPYTFYDIRITYKGIVTDSIGTSMQFVVEGV